MAQNYAYDSGYDSYQSVQYKSFQNFLENSALVASNLKPDEEGNIKVPLDLHQYSSLLILASDENSVTQVDYDLDCSSNKIETRDLSLSSPLNPNKNYNETRNTKILAKDETYKIDDITSTEYLIVDSLEKIQQVQNEIRKVSGYGGISDLDFITKWNSYEKEKKNNKYSKFMSHEMNLFLYFKDKEYFNNVVLPFIANKMEKTFIDNWLIGDYDKLYKYTDIKYFDKLNALEKCLLVHAVIKKDTAEAKALVDRIRISAEINKIKIEQKNRIFDTVINLNMMQDVNELMQRDADMMMDEQMMPSTIGGAPGMDAFGGAFGASNMNADYGNYSNNAGALFGASNARNNLQSAQPRGGGLFSNVGNALSNFFGGGRQAAAKKMAQPQRRNKRAMNANYAEDYYDSDGGDDLFSDDLMR